MLSLLMILAACNMQAQNLPTPDGSGNVYVTATVAMPTADAEGVVWITATPVMNDVVNVASVDTAETVPTSIVPPTEVVPPTATIPPTAIPNPRELLDEADKILRNGYLEEAVGAYQAVLNQPNLDANLRGEAAFKLSQAAIREGLFSEALTALNTLIDTLPSDSHVPQGYFLRGDAKLGLGEWESAIADFQQYLALRPGVIDSYAWERIADAQFALGQTDTALASYSQAINANRSLVPQLVLRERVAQIYNSAGRVDEAVAQYDAILNVAQNDPYRASINLYSAQALLGAGRTEEALARARRIFDNFTDTAAAYPAMQMLLENGAELDAYQQGIVNYNNGDYVAAVDAFNVYTSTYVLEVIPANLYLLLGRAYRELGNPQAALVSFRTLVDQHPGDPLFGEALLEQGRTYFLNGQFDEAISTYLNVAEQYNTLPDVASEAMWRAGYLYGTQKDDFTASRETFTQLASLYPNSEWALSGLQIAASTAVANGETAVAENLYGRIAAIATGENQAAAYYWVGRLALQRGDTAASQQAFQLARQAAPDSFFAVRANDIVEGREAFQPPAQLRFEFDTQADRLAAETWLRQTFAVEQTGDLHLPSPELQSDPRMIRGQELWAVAAYDEAQVEFDALLDESRANRDVLRSYQLAHYLQSVGAYLPSIVAAADIITASGVATLDAPAYIARLRYPAYYHELVVEQATKYGYDPLLQLSLIRQESLFDANALSVANAKGLAQVIPSTAVYIAEELNWENFEDRDLYRPYVGIAFGAFYLDEQLRIFNGNKAAALAAYNAGPGYTQGWVRLSGGDIDALVATITFEETRRYIQRIYSNYNIYRELYAG
jgi:soluble lytic murein transglycosylase